MPYTNQEHDAGYESGTGWKLFMMQFSNMMPDTDPNKMPDTNPNMMPETDPNMMPDTDPNMMPEMDPNMMPDTNQEHDAGYNSET